MTTKIQNGKTKIFVFFLSLFFMILAFLVLRYVRVFGLEINTGCKTKECNYKVSFYSGIARYSQWEKDLIDNLIRIACWHMGREIGQGYFYFGLYSDGGDGTICGNDVNLAIGYSYSREFKPTNIYTRRDKRFIFLDTCHQGSGW